MGKQESVSGTGSTLSYTENVREELPKLVSELQIISILDAPCGDFNWFRHVEFSNPVKYVGGDIVEPLVDSLQSRYGSDRRSFIHLDVTKDTLPTVDIWMCRDCLFHLSNKDIFAALHNFASSNIKYLLTSTHVNCTRNTDIPTGSFRELNLYLPPYNLSTPIRTIDDWVEGFPKRHLALWERTAVIRDLA